MSAVPTLRPHRFSHALSAVAATERATRAAYRLRVASRIAKRLAWQHGIPPFESTLVTWLTTARCTCNIDALTDWVRIQLGDPSLFAVATGATLMADLSHRLARLLASMEDSQTW